MACRVAGQTETDIYRTHRHRLTEPSRDRIQSSLSEETQLPLGEEAQLWLLSLLCLVLHAAGHHSAHHR